VFRRDLAAGFFKFHAFPLEDEECETGDSITGYVDIAQNAGIDVGYEERITGSVSHGGSR
jgi:hypothetical protein